jgi:hypothetical protein
MSFSGSNMSTFAGNSTHNNFPKFAIDLSYDQTLGLDLAPGFNHGFPTGTGMNLGLNMMDAHEMERLPVVRQKRKKVAWLEVDKLLDGECNQVHAVEAARWSGSSVCLQQEY